MICFCAYGTLRAQQQAWKYSRHAESEPLPPLPSLDQLPQIPRPAAARLMALIRIAACGCISFEPVSLFRIADPAFFSFRRWFYNLMYKFSVCHILHFNKGERSSAEPEAPRPRFDLEERCRLVQLKGNTEELDRNILSGTFHTKKNTQMLNVYVFCRIGFDTINTSFRQILKR